ncbi:hypothetical protein MFLAVUS_001441 [Mucor flavus]|uniref:GATA-type domain-containing protein n=1 Tax=Mucor flavus TaxID=439312 RepID=A0ABP9YMI2_9FUNG
MGHCIWSFLSIKNLEFVFTSSYDKLKGHSLFELIHPDEVSLAQRDLYKFMDSNLLGGSVTRCRLIDYSNNNFITATPSYIVVDIIMYVATDNLVLAFFHRQQVIINGTDGSSVLLSWPDHYPNEMDGAQMHILNDRPMSPGISCFHCVQQTIRTTLSEYGSIAFVLIQVKKSVSLPSSPLYDYKRPDPIRKNRSSTTSNKLENLLSPIHKPPQKNHCQSCGTSSSPEWRRGPTGHKTLCNACGLRYSRSVARQVKTAINQQKQQHSVFQCQDTPHTSPKSNSSSPSYSYNRDVLKMNYQPYFNNNSNNSLRNHHSIK